MKRLHFFEFGDQRWLPKILREGLSALLKAQSASIYQWIVPKLQTFLLIADIKEVIDICAGSGGPWEVIMPELKANGVCISVLLTDKFPPENPPNFHTDIRFHPTPIDANHLPEDLQGCRTFFTAFHHFRPSEARQILHSTVLARQPIAIFEFTERKWQNLLGMVMAPMVVGIQLPFLKPLKWQWILFTYLIPLLPIIYFWDGLVSHWRSYSQAELKKMIAEIHSAEYEWESGEIQDLHSGGKIQYLLGWDKLYSNQITL